MMTLYEALLSLREKVVDILVDWHMRKQAKAFEKNYFSKPTKRKSKTKPSYIIPDDYTNLYESMKKE